MKVRATNVQKVLARTDQLTIALLGECENASPWAWILYMRIRFWYVDIGNMVSFCHSGSMVVLASSCTIITHLWIREYSEFLIST